MRVRDRVADLKKQGQSLANGDAHREALDRLSFDERFDAAGQPRIVSAKGREPRRALGVGHLQRLVQVWTDLAPPVGYRHLRSHGKLGVEAAIQVQASLLPPALYRSLRDGLHC